MTGRTAHRREAVSRLFVAIRLPGPFKAAVRKLQSGLPRARWLNADGMHLTLAFIGDVDEATQQQIETGLNGVQAPKFRMEMSGLGHFPLRGAPRVLWVGVAPRAEIVALAEAVRSTLRSLGLSVDRGEVRPHVTIARFHQRLPVAKLKRYLAANAGFRTAPTRIACFHLFSSELGTTGASYSIEKTFPLNGAPRENSGPAQRNQT